MERLGDSLWGAPVALAAEPATLRIMPAFSLGTEAHRHSIHSALSTLAALGVPAERISILRTGREAIAAGTVVRQYPPPGDPLLPDTAVRLHIAGLGFNHALPVGLWDSGGETHAGTREILEGLDDPLEKLGHWFHEGAPLFRISPDDLGACARWLTLFGVDTEGWPHALWYRLASLIAGMAEFSCSSDGTAFVLESLLGLPLSRMTYVPTFTAVPQASLSSLGAQASRLGIDLVAGDAVEDLATLELEIGPVSLEVFEQFAEYPEGERLLRQTLEMVLPVSGDYTVRWTVLDKSRAPRLGMRESNSRLGINTHLGNELGQLLTEPFPTFSAGATAPSVGATP